MWRFRRDGRPSIRDPAASRLYAGVKPSASPIDESRPSRHFGNPGPLQDRGSFLPMWRCQRDGRTSSRAPAASRLYAGERLILQWGGHAEALAPVELRQRIAAAGRKLATAHG
jgi:hypothetical protein